MKPTKVKVMRNIWGNYVCYIGQRRAMETEEEWKAQAWLAEQLQDRDKVISDKSYLQQRSVLT